MTRAVRVRSLLLVLVLGLAGLSGCVQVPSAGPIERVPGQAEACQNCVNVEVAPPATGDDPSEIVEGYLRATSNYEPNYSTARQFLSGMAAESWRPEDGVSVYTGTPVGDENGARLDGRLVGELAEDRTYTAKDEKKTWDFGLVQENGEWRIGSPPKGLMVGEYFFSHFYLGYSVYFVGSNNRSLVPERIYLPALRNPANIASALMSALLHGPSKWLEPAAGSVIPMDTLLSVASVTITNGIAEVPLTDAVLTLSDPQRTVMASQIVYTLRQVSGVKGVLITANSQKFRVPESDATSLVIPLDAFSRDVDPVPFVTDQLYAVRKGKVNLVTTPNETPGLQPMVGPLGQKSALAVDSLAVSVNGTDVAVVTDGGRALRRAAIGTGDVITLKTGLTEMLRPQFTRYDEIWTIGVRNGKQWLARSSPDQDQVVIARVPDGGAITAFRISPDGARMVVVRTTAWGAELSLARITRGERFTVDGWRQIDLTRTGFARVEKIADVAWLDANDLLLLGADTKDGPFVPVRVAADASRVVPTDGGPEWRARQLAVLTRPQTALVVGSDSLIWRDTGNEWRQFLVDVSRVAYAG